MSEGDPVIDVDNVTKEFGGVVAVEDLSLTVERGEVYGFLGPNGAGKTTTIHMLLSLVNPTSGTIRLFGNDISQCDCHDRIGVLPAHADLYSNLTAREHLEFVVRVKDADDDPAELCERVGLDDAIDQQAGGFSTGMTQRLKLAIALVGEPELLVLDEPTSGLDPNGARQMRQLIEAESERGATVFFSSHILDQVEQLCDRIAIIDEGRLVAEDSISALCSEFDDPGRVRVEFADHVDGVADRVLADDVVNEADVDGRTLELTLDDAAETNRVLADLCGAGPQIRSVDTETASLEELFARYTGREVAR